MDVAYFYACAALALAGALAVVVAKNPIRSAMGLLLLILSVAGLFLELHAQFLAAVQLIVYAGAIVVLFLFVIMLLGPNAATPNDRRGVFSRAFGGGLFALSGLAGLGSVVLAASAAHRRVPLPSVDSSFGGIDAFGSVLFADTLVPFELSSALLMVAVVGSIAVARGRQGQKTLSPGERQIAGSAPEAPYVPADHSGVFSHELDAGANGSEVKRELRMIGVEPYVTLSALLFIIGGTGFLVRRNVLVNLMSIEIMLNSVNLALVAFNRSHLTTGSTQTYVGQSHTGQVFAFFIIAAEAAEVAVGLAIVLALYRLRKTVRSDDADLLRN